MVTCGARTGMPPSTISSPIKILSGEGLNDNCFYPCFNTSNILRKTTSLRASVNTFNASTGDSHTPNGWDSDSLQPLIYTTVVSFTVAQLFLLCTARLKLCNRAPVDNPLKIWTERKQINQVSGVMSRQLSLALMQCCSGLQRNLISKTAHGRGRRRQVFIFYLIP